MKKLIAAALAILLSSTGLVVVDHTLEDRVVVLENQVSSLQGDVSSLNESIVSLEKSESNNQTTHKDISNKFLVSDTIPVSDSQKTEFNLHYMKTSFSEYIFDNEYAPNYYDEYKDNVVFETDYKLTLSELSFTVLSDKKKEENERHNYTTTHLYDYREITMLVKCKGKTSSEFAGKTVKFDLIYDKDASILHTAIYKPNTLKAVIGEDGSFSFDANKSFDIPVENGGFNECYLVNPTIILY